MTPHTPQAPGTPGPAEAPEASDTREAADAPGAPDRIVVVGASLAGLRAAQALREAGHHGPLTLIGAEPHAPYDRPPLSKELLQGHTTPAGLALEDTAPLALNEYYGRRAVHLDTATRLVHLDDDTAHPYDALVIATGATARTWPGPLPARGVHTLRTLDDARALKADLDPATPRHLMIAGGGFIGCEIASVARELGHTVTLVTPEPLALHSAVGPEAAAFLTRLHQDAGVEILTGHTVTALTGTDRPTHATLTGPDGTRTLSTDTVLLALGALPHTDWLATSGLRLDGGLVTDAYTRVLDVHGRPQPRITAAGDITRFPHPHTPDLVNLGHWSNAAEQARAAAHNLLHPHTPVPYHPVASFWSTQYGVRLRAVGLPRYADRTEVRELDPERRRLDVAYYRDDRLIGALTANRAARITAYQAQLADDISRTTLTPA
ncbi:NAD(P)/FAD-dependent oxidoreductase [Streptomyces laurentii]|uniref:NAD(P)/FAD-dependent oxidoreductase n=1 Tax=Streptomyces laurentii TaxID=39478 RepID=UPI0036D0A38B